MVATYFLGVIPLHNWFVRATRAVYLHGFMNLIVSESRYQWQEKDSGYRIHLDDIHQTYYHNTASNKKSNA
jgi:hypothetical protein